MSRIEIYGDESGDFSFDRSRNPSSYFMVATVTMTDYRLVHEIVELRRELLWSGQDVRHGFHARADNWPIRNAMFDVLSASTVRIDATILTKSNLDRHLRSSNLQVWSLAWFLHLRHVVRSAVSDIDELMVIAARLDTKIRPNAAKLALDDICELVGPRDTRSYVVPAAMHPGLQIADYCCWAIQRKWEHGKLDAYRRVGANIASESVFFEER